MASLSDANHSDIDHEETVQAENDTVTENALAESQPSNVIESVDSTQSKRSRAEARDDVSIMDNTEQEVRRQWSSDEETDKENDVPRRKRKRSPCPSPRTRRRSPSPSPPSRKRRSKSKAKSRRVSSSESSESSSSDSTSSSDSSDSSDDVGKPFKPKLSSKSPKFNIPKHVTKYFEKYATKGLKKKVRQEVASNLPVPKSKKLKALEIDRFFKKNFCNKSNTRFNGKLEKSKINVQLRILDSFGPLSVLWSEAVKIKKEGKGMDPSDVIQLVQRAAVLIGNAHHVFNTERRKAMLAKYMPDNIDLLNEKKCVKALSNCKGNLFGKKFLHELAKENKDNKELRDLLLPYANKNKGGKNGRHSRHFDNKRSNQFFQSRPSDGVQSGGHRQGRGIPAQDRTHQQNQSQWTNKNYKQRAPIQNQPKGNPGHRK